MLQPFKRRRLKLYKDDANLGKSLNRNSSFQKGGTKKKVKYKDMDLGYVEDRINEWSGLKKHAEKTRDMSHNAGLQNENPGSSQDAVRHSSQAAFLSSRLGIPLANILGALHELSGEMPLQETAMDFKNNLIGSLVGKLPIGDDYRTKLLIEMQKRGLLSSYVDEKGFFTKDEYQKGGMMGNYDDIYYDEYGNKMYKGKRLFSSRNQANQYLSKVNQRPHTGFSYSSSIRPLKKEVTNYIPTRVEDEQGVKVGNINKQGQPVLANMPVNHKGKLVGHRTPQGRFIPLGKPTPANPTIQRFTRKGNTLVSKSPLPGDATPPSQHELRRRFWEQEARKNKMFTMLKAGGYINTTGYTKGSPSSSHPFNIIPGSKITMKNVDFPINGIGSNGLSIRMQPGRDYDFGDSEYVLETPA